MNRIFFLFLLLVSSMVHANTDGHTTEKLEGVVDNKKYYDIPECNIDNYKEELLEYQKLQRQNMMLKLKMENNNIQKSLKSHAVTDNKITLLAVLSANAGKYSAKIYDGRVKNVKEGDIISDKFKIKRIYRDSIIIHNQESKKDEVIKLYGRG